MLCNSDHGASAGKSFFTYEWAGKNWLRKSLFFFDKNLYLQSLQRVTFITENQLRLRAKDCG